jgi:predicted LPLAT superfamily acyltransferase
MSAHWSERHEGGGRFALWLISNIGLRLGRPAARLLLYPITLYFFFRRGLERRQSRAFLNLALGRPATTWSVLKHIHCYAATILDRVFLLSDSRLSEASSRFDIRVHGLEQLESQMAHGRGVILLGAHIGSFEVLRVLAVERPDVQVRVVMDTLQTPAMTAMLHALNPAVAAGVIHAGQDVTAIALAIQDAAKQGALIGLLADRARPRESTRDAVFFGAPAPFPVAPYLIASVLELPTVLCFGLYRGANRYDLYFETFAECIQIPRRERAARLGEWTQRYAARLEHYTRMDPFNWFNFYDFWHRSDDARAVLRDSASTRSVAGHGGA